MKEINTLLQIAHDTFTGEFTEDHVKNMRYIYGCIEDLEKKTGKKYRIAGTSLVEE